MEARLPLEPGSLVIRRLSLRDFRNYRDRVFYLRPGFTYISGPNAVGKTNLLEAIFYLTALRSPRRARDQDLVRLGTGGFRLEGEFHGTGGAMRVEVCYRVQEGKRIVVDGVARRPSEYVGRANAVFFAPDDLLLIKGSPAGRRDFLDGLLTRLYPLFGRWQNTYQRALAQRNAALKRGQAGAVEMWEEQMALPAARVVLARVKALRRLAARLSLYLGDITDGREELSLSYRASLRTLDIADAAETLAGKFAVAWKQDRAKDLASGITAVGPHRDDYAFILDGQDGRQFASQGQQRTIILSLKLAELDFIADVRRERPILLLDDVLSELDASRREYLLRTLSGTTQTIMSGTEPPEAVGGGQIAFSCIRLGE